MFVKLREVLLTQYIGAFLIALFVWQAAIEIITQIIRSGYWFYYTHRSSVLSEYSREAYRWDNLILTTVRVALFLAVAYGLANWLYGLELRTPTDEDTEPTSSDAPGES